MRPKLCPHIHPTAIVEPTAQLGRDGWNYGGGNHQAPQAVLHRDLFQRMKSITIATATASPISEATGTAAVDTRYLREAIEKRGGLENIGSLEELRQAVIEGAVHRHRLKLLTERVAITAIIPMDFASGVGGVLLAPMAFPALGGMLISDEDVDLFLPVRFYWVRRARRLKLHRN